MTPAFTVCAAWSVSLAATVALLPGRPGLGAAALGSAVVASALLLGVRPLRVPSAILAALLGGARAELPAPDGWVRAHAPLFAGRDVTVVGRIADDPKPSPAGYQLLLEPALVVEGRNALPPIGALLVRARGPALGSFGDEVEVAGRLAMPADLPGFDRRAYLAQRGVFLELKATSVSLRRVGGGVGALPGWIRRQVEAGLHAVMPAPHEQMLAGIVLGIRSGIPAEFQRDRISTGLVHLLVLSGLKVAVFARLVTGLLDPFLGRASTWPALALIGAYALVGGATPAAVRAAAMGALALAGSRLGRPSHVWTSLAITSAAMLAWHPDLAWDVGFQLSFAGTAAIILLTPGITRRLGQVPEVLRDPLAVTLAAQVGSLPLTATDFHVISPVGPVANALVLPALPVMVAGGMVISALAALAAVPGVPLLGQVLALPLTGLIAYVEQVAQILARVPGAAIAIPSFPGWASLAYYAGLAGALMAARTDGSHRRAAVAASLLAPLAIGAIELGIAARASPRAVVLAVGDGQAVLLAGPHGHVLIDGGPSPARLAAGLGSALPPWVRSLDAIIVTAPSLEHVGGLAGLAYPASEVVVPDVAMPGSSWRTAVLTEVTGGARLWQVGAGDVLELAGLRVEILGPAPGDAGDVPGEGYLSLRVVGPDGRALCDFSDLDAGAQAAAAAGLRGGCDYILLPSEGRKSVDAGLLRAFPGARLLVSTNGGNLARGLPAARISRTDQDGPIEVSL